MANKKLTPQQLQEVRQLIIENWERWQRGDDEKVAKKYGVPHWVIGWHRRELGIYYTCREAVAEYMKTHPEATIKEVATKFKVSDATVRTVDKHYQLGRTRPRKLITVTQADVEGKTFKEVQKMLGVSASYLCHIRRRRNLQFIDTKNSRTIVGHRENMQALRKLKADKIAEILAATPWCNKEQCNKQCVECCKKWLTARNKHL